MNVADSGGETDRSGALRRHGDVMPGVRQEQRGETWLYRTIEDAVPCALRDPFVTGAEQLAFYRVVIRLSPCSP